MARLNEPVAPVESIDSLKRRFIRQNRELARVNSSQSIRIRSLEGDLSRLLGENAGLQKRIIELEKTAFDGVSRDAAKSIASLKDRFDAKIQELTELATDLGKLKRDNKQKTSRRSSSFCSTEKSPRERQWKNKSMLSDIFATQEGILPSILEDKCYPRKTLESADIGLIISESSQDSPDIGPPPRTFLDRRENDGPLLDLEGEGVSRLLSANLETRKKRRDTRMVEDLANTFSDLGSPSVGDIESLSSSGEPEKQHLRAGAKRKFDMQETTFPSIPRNANKENFTVSRRSNDAATAKSGISQKVKDIPELKASERENGNVRLIPDTIKSPSRRILGPKSVNADPLSPQKTLRESTKPSKDHKLKPQATDNTLFKAKDSQRKSKPSIIRIPPPIEAPPKLVELDTEVIKSEPKTPGILDIFSPLSSQPSEARPEARDTPPPSDLKVAHTGEALEGAGRPSRRARANVSYAEPSLITKMRRPTKELADAVVREDRRSISAPLSQVKQEALVDREEAGLFKREPSTTLQSPSSETVHLATAPNISISTGPDPPSPLKNKSDAAQRPRQRRPNGRRSTAYLHREASDPSTSSESPSTLASISANNQLDNTTANLPHDPASSQASQPAQTYPKQSIPSQVPIAFSTSRDATTQPHPSAPPTATSSRRQSTGMRTTSLTDLSSRNDKGATGGLGAAAAAALAEGARARGERIAARRRSMVL